MQQNRPYGWRDSVENALDDLRHTWERLWFGRKVTGDIEQMFPDPALREPETAAQAFDRLYGKDPRPEPGQAQERGREAPDHSQTHEIER